MDPLQKLQLDIAGYLESAPEETVLAVYEHVPVIIFRPRKKEDGSIEDAVMIENTISNALAGLEPKNGKSGLAAIVMMPDVGIPAELEKLKGPFLQYEATVRIIEDPLINMGEDGVRVTAEELAILTLQSLHGWYSGRTQLPLRGRERAALVPVSLPGKPMQVAWDVNLTMRHQLQPLDATSTVLISSDGALPNVQVVMSCEDEGASIYYTTDGSFPSSQNSGAVLYEAPLTLTEATSIRAVAYLADCLPSHVAEHDVR